MRHARCSVIADHSRTARLSWLSTGGDSAVRDVMVGGEWLIRDRHHAKEEEIMNRFRRVMKGLWEGESA